MLQRLKESVLCVREGYIAITIVFLLALAGFFLVGRVYTDTLARGLIQAMLPAIQTLCFAVITSASTVITLLMAVLGFARRIDNEFDRAFYIRIWFIATIATVSLVMGAMLLLMVTIPIIEAETLQTWYRVAYWVIVVSASTMMSLLVGMIVSLYRTLFGLISIASPAFEED